VVTLNTTFSLLALIIPRINPHIIQSKTAADRAEIQARIAQGIPQFDPSVAPVGFRNPVAYATEPKTRYQQAMRRKNLKMVENHTTDCATKTVAEYSTRIPLIPLANHRREHFISFHSSSMPQLTQFYRLNS
jgi:hypothetical protein